MDPFGTYGYPLILIIIGAILGGPLGAFGILNWTRYREYRANSIPEGLRELATRYECADWIEDTKQRVARKNEIFNQMTSFLIFHPVTKRRLLDGGHLGRFIAMAAAIQQDPNRRDAELILRIDSAQLPQGHAQYILIDAVDRLRSRFD
jgi:hypothetical protein